MTEIFGTLGPACSKTDILENMFSEGMTGMRLNMSHSGLKESAEIISNFHEAAKRTGVKADLLIDMQGPEIRIGILSSPLSLQEEDRVFLKNQQMEEDTDFGQDAAGWIPVPESVITAAEAGDRVLLDDGRIELLIPSEYQNNSEEGHQVYNPDEKEISGRYVQKKRNVIPAIVIRGGVLKSRKSLKIVDKYISGPAITQKDRENISLISEYKVTSLMQPFVTKKEELIEVRNELRKYALDNVRIFAKIENRDGMNHIKEILPYADVIVIARGDLGNDMPLWELPAAQKKIADICRQAGKPFLVVTQMLASMEKNPVPTRAEVSDIFHAVMDGAGAVMVTNETAVGAYPVQVIRYLKKTAEEAEKMVASYT